jgi:hypothetical protein
MNRSGSDCNPDVPQISATVLLRQFHLDCPAGDALELLLRAGTRSA